MLIAAIAITVAWALSRARTIRRKGPGDPDR
jgi:hypothetical protein